MRCRCDVGASAVIKARKPRVVASAGGENGAEAARRGVGVGGAMARKPRVVASASAAKMARKPRVVASASAVKIARKPRVVASASAVKMARKRKKEGSKTNRVHAEPYIDG